MKENEYLYNLYYYYDTGNEYATGGVTKDFASYKGLRTMWEVLEHIQRTMSTGGLTIPSFTKEGKYPSYANCVEAYDFIPYHRITLIQYYKVKHDA